MLLLRTADGGVIAVAREYQRTVRQDVEPFGDGADNLLEVFGVGGLEPGLLEGRESLLQGGDEGMRIHQR